MRYTCAMDELSGATGRDMARQGAPASDSDFTLSLEEVAERYARAGHARTLRSLQRYCVSGHLDAQKVATMTGDKYLVSAQSVERHIAQIAELAAMAPVAPGRGVARQDAAAELFEERSAPPGDSELKSADKEDKAIATNRDTSRQVETDLDIFEHPYVKRLEAQVEKWEGKFYDQVRRTEEIQNRNQDKLVELQRMTTIGQSKTLAEFILQARTWLTGGESEPPTSTPA